MKLRQVLGLVTVSVILLLMYCLSKPGQLFSPPANITLLKAIYSSIAPGAGNIFFVETSCIFNYPVDKELKARQACAIESAARLHPKRKVYLLDSCLSAENGERKGRQPRHELSYPNVQALPLHLAAFLAGTPLEPWLDTGLLAASQWPVEHASDVIRLVLLWRFGGIYLDLDVVVLRPLDSLGSSFVGAESNVLANGVMGFSHNGADHVILDECLEEVRLNYKGDVWNHNGPLLITRVLYRMCNISKVMDITPENCYGLTVQPPEAFYKIPYLDWKRFFDPEDKGALNDLTNSSIAHMWNKFSSATPVQVGSQQPYAILASRHCPRVYSYCGATF